MGPTSTKSGDMTTVLDRADPEELAELLRSLRWSLTYHHTEQIVDVEVDTIGDRVDKLCVRGRTGTLTTQLGVGSQWWGGREVEDVTEDPGPLMF